MYKLLNARAAKRSFATQMFFVSSQSLLLVFDVIDLCLRVEQIEFAN